MARSIVFGQYLPGKSVVHRLDPRAKLILSLVFMVAVFVAQDFAGLAVAAAFTAGFYAAARISPAQAFKSIAPLFIIVIIAAIINLFFVQSGQVLAQWWIFCISTGGIRQALFIALRLTLLLLGMSLLTLTTTTLDITEAFEYLLSPFERFGVPAHELGMMMGIALRFLPQFADELQTIYRAQLSRGASMNFNPFKGGFQTLGALMVPLFTSAFRHADTLSAAMDARCYRGGEGRARLHPLAYAKRDAIACIVIVFMIAAIIVANIVL